MTEKEAWGQAFENGRKVGDAEGYARGLKETVKHGRWVELHLGKLRCSVCEKESMCVGWLIDGKYDYCPHCGARMDGDSHA